MLPLGLSAKEQREFHQALRSSHTVKATVQVLKLDHTRVADVSAHLIDGEVNVIHEADQATRSASITLFDPSGVLSLEGDDPSDGAVFLDNMIRIVLSYTWPGFDDWVDVPVFCGPVVSINRDDFLLSVEAQGKELLSMSPTWEPRSWSVNYITTLIRWCLAKSGENRMDIPHIKRITTEVTNLHRQTRPWKVAQRLASDLNRQLFYDGRGVARLRKLPRTPVWVFRDGERGTLTTRPRVARDIENVKNVVWVRGKKPKGAKERVGGSMQLPKANPMSPEKLGRNGAPQWRLEVVESEHLKTDRECEDRAVEIVNERYLQAYTVQADSVPVPHLEPGDLVTLDVSGSEQRDFRLRAFTIPIDGSDSMAIGYTRKMRKGPKAKNNPIISIVVGNPNPIFSDTVHGSAEARLGAELEGATW